MKVKRILSLLLVVVTIISCIGVMTVSAGTGAEDGLKIYFSTDKRTWKNLNLANFDMDGSKGEYLLNISDQTQFGYFYVDVPEGGSARLTYHIQDTGSSTLPKDPWYVDMSSTNDWGNMRNHFSLRVVAANEGTQKDPVMMPLRFGKSFFNCEYTAADETYTRYTVRLYSHWTNEAMRPTLAEKNSMFARSGAASKVGLPMLMYGAALGNDNLTFLSSYTNYTDENNSNKSWDQARMWIGANFSRYLEGSPYVMMPITGMTANYQSAAIQNLETKFFDIQTQEAYSYTDSTNPSNSFSGEGYDGEVVVLMASPAAEGSVYLDADSGWECVNDGEQAHGITVGSSPRNKNDYFNTDYFGVAYKWITTSFKAVNADAQLTDTANKYRLSDPGMLGEVVNNTHRKGAVKLIYAYRKQFKAGEAVSVYNPGNITSDEAASIMIPIIKYYLPEPNLTIGNVESIYDPDSEAFMLYVESKLNNFSPYIKADAYYAIYDNNDRLVGVQTHDAQTTTDEFVFPCKYSDIEGGKFKVYMWGRDSKPYIVNDGIYNIDDIILE